MPPTASSRPSGRTATLSVPHSGWADRSSRPAAASPGRRAGAGRESPSPRGAARGRAGAGVDRAAGRVVGDALRITTVAGKDRNRKALGDGPDAGVVLPERTGH